VVKIRSSPYSRAQRITRSDIITAENAKNAKKTVPEF
jgi:hypothetical protein